MVGLWVVSFIDLGLWVVIPMSGFRVGDLGLWICGRLVGLWVVIPMSGFLSWRSVGLWVCGKMVGSRGWWRSVGVRVRDQWVYGFKFMGMQILNDT